MGRAFPLFVNKTSILFVTVLIVLSALPLSSGVVAPHRFKSINPLPASGDFVDVTFAPSGDRAFILQGTQMSVNNRDLTVSHVYEYKVGGGLKEVFVDNSEIFKHMVWNHGGQIALLIGGSSIWLYNGISFTEINGSRLAYWSGASWCPSSNKAVVFGNDAVYNGHGVVAIYDGTAITRISPSGMTEIDFADWMSGCAKIIASGKEFQAGKVMKYNPSDKTWTNWAVPGMGNYTILGMRWDPSYEYALIWGEAAGLNKPSALGKIVGDSVEVLYEGYRAANIMDIVWNPTNSSRTLAYGFGTLSNMFDLQPTVGYVNVGHNSVAEFAFHPSGDYGLAAIVGDKSSQVKKLTGLNLTNFTEVVDGNIESLAFSNDGSEVVLVGHYSSVSDLFSYGWQHPRVMVYRNGAFVELTSNLGVGEIFDISWQSNSKASVLGTKVVVPDPVPPTTIKMENALFTYSGGELKDSGIIMPTNTYSLQYISWDHDGNRAILSGRSGAYYVLQGTTLANLTIKIGGTIGRAVWFHDSAQALSLINNDYPLPGNLVRYVSGGSAQMVYKGNGFLDHLAVSPTEDSALFEDSVQDQGSRIMIYKNGTVTPFYDFTKTGKTFVDSISWDPAGERVLITTSTDPGSKSDPWKSGIYEYKDGVMTKLQLSFIDYIYASWAPAGGKALIIGSDGNGMDLTVAVYDGTTFRTIEMPQDWPFQVFQIKVSWSPKGDEAFLLSAMGNEVYAIYPDKLWMELFAYGGIDLFMKPAIDWSPDGKQILLGHWYSGELLAYDFAGFTGPQPVAEPKPPIIVNNTPAATVVNLTGPTDFSIKVFDPNADKVEITWTLDNKTIGTGNDVTIDPKEVPKSKKTHEVVAVVTDGKFEVEQNWTVITKGQDKPLPIIPGKQKLGGFEAWIWMVLIIVAVCIAIIIIVVLRLNMKRPPQIVPAYEVPR